MRGGICTRIDEAVLKAEIDDFAARDPAANSPYLASTRAEQAIFKPSIREALERPTAVQRFAAHLPAR